jgi:hypothetical protein
MVSMHVHKPNEASNQVVDILMQTLFVAPSF